MEVIFIYTIYKYTNKANNKVYIGQTKNSLEKRAETNGSNYKSCPRFYHAIQEFGWDCFESEILEQVETVQEANIKERLYINLFNANNEAYGYNITSGGRDADLPETSKKTISLKAKERYKDKTKNPMYGKKHTEESLKLMSEKKIGASNPMYGKHVTQEAKNKRAKTIKENNIYLGHEFTEQEKQACSERMLVIAQQWSKKVHCIEDDLYFDSITKAAKFYNVTVSTLSGHLNKRQHTCAEKHFEFAD